MKVIFLLALFACANAANELKIYFFNIGQCDSQLIVFPSGYSIMIDAGEVAGTTKENGVNAKYLAKRVSTILGKKKIDVFVMTHHHIDHTGGYKIGGVWYLLEKGGFTFGKFLKRNAGTYKGSKLSGCKKSAVDWKYVGEMSEKTAKFVCYATATKAKTKLSKVAENAHRCNTKQIVPPDEGASVLVLIRDGIGVKDKDGKKVNRNTISNSKPGAENDFSVCLRVKYGDFVYATCGDLSGKEFTYGDKKFHDIESAVAPMMGEVDLLKVNHHGSKTSTNKKWCTTLKPTVSVITCGGRSLPHKGPLTNLMNVNSQVYTTGTNCNKDSAEQFKKIIQMGDDIVVSYAKGAKTFTVASAAGKKTKTYNVKLNKPAPTKCTLLEK